MSASTCSTGTASRSSAPSTRRLLSTIHLPKVARGGDFMQLIGYFRSSAAFRVRIALNLKGIAVDHTFRHLRKGEHRAPDYVAINPQKLVPALVLDSGEVLTQSMAILEYLEESHPKPPLLPADPVGRARVRSLALIPTADIHPIQNRRVMRFPPDMYD